MQTDVAKTIDQPDMRGPVIKAAHKIDVRSSDARWQRTGRWPAYPQCRPDRSEEHTSELQSLMRISYAVFCLKKKNNQNTTKTLRQWTPEHKDREKRHTFINTHMTSGTLQKLNKYS